jgi:DNA-binding CsgD family transcriptional regulator
LGLVHPSAAEEFLAAVARTAADRIPVTLLTRMRAGNGRWADRYCLLIPICEHQPPRLGVIISTGPSGAASGPSGIHLDEHARHAALEVQAMKVLDTLPALSRLPHGSELSARQTEILARLVAGQRPADVARSMFLSPSTVRSHLAAIYRKFDVHSEAELLAALLRSASSDHGY